MKQITELEALQNAANDLEIDIGVKQEQDKRKSVSRYFAMYKSKIISPVLDYEQMNYFLLGWRNSNLNS